MIAETETQSEQAELFNQWKQHPVTELLLKKLLEEQNRLKDTWASGGLMASFEGEIIARNAAAQGACSAFSDVANYTHEDLFGDE